MRWGDVVSVRFTIGKKRRVFEGWNINPPVVDEVVQG